MQPYDYQERGINEIWQILESEQRVCYQLGTGGGKTAIFSFIIKDWLNKFDSNVLVLCHRTELITQTEETLSVIGIGSEPILSKVKQPKNHSRVYISMVETASRRLDKNPYFFKNIGLVIVDECHILMFEKVFSKFQSAKVLGCTATPAVLKRIKFWRCSCCRNDYNEQTECCDQDAEEWTRPFALAEIYHNIVTGPQMKEIQKFGSIVPEISFIKHYTDDSKLKIDSDGEFTSETVEGEYGSENAAFNVLLNYKELCEGKKTMVFNSSSKANLLIYNKFLEAGYDNVRMFDSVNSEQSGNRSDLLKWFADTPNAILCNVGVFTTGFDSREVEAIILNRPTGSLSLFLQIVGRGGRSSKLIYKPHFILVDGGGNIDRFGEWSHDRDWKEIFHKGLGKEKAKKEDAINIHQCMECGFLFPKSQSECPDCGALIPVTPKKTRIESDSEDVLMPIRKIPPPNGESIYIYTLSRGENINFAFKIMISQIVDLFKFYRVTNKSYIKNRDNGSLDKKVASMIRNCYFVLLRKNDIQTSGRRTLAELQKRTLNEIAKYYESKGVENTTGVPYPF